MKSCCIHWFRKGLRLHDNPALLETCVYGKKNSAIVYPVFVLDPFLYKNKNSQKRNRMGTNRLKFLIECLDDLNQSLNKIGSRLLVFEGDPVEIITKLVTHLKPTLLTFEKDTEPYSLKRDDEICNIISDSSCKIRTFISHTLFDPDQLLNKADSEQQDKNWPRGIPPSTYQSFIKNALGTDSNIDKVPIPVEDVSEIPSDVDSMIKTIKEIFKSGEYNVSKNHMYSVPKLNDLEVKESPQKSYFMYYLFNSRGGESMALKILNNNLENTQKIVTFKKPNTYPTDIKPGTSTTSLSPYLSFGCLSCRKFHKKLVDIEKKNPKHSKPPMSLRGQLYFREMFYCCGYATPNFDKMINNPICLQVDWDCKNEGQSNEYLNAWTNAKTGYPWIDAAMTQLRKEGWIHHLARHAVACFLTRGDIGVEVFEELLIDADWSSNNGNWLWLRVYSPISFPKKTDKNGDYVRHYLPVLKNIPAKYIYEPWKCPIEEQKKANCIIGKDYPNPILDHEQCKSKNIQKIKNSYQKHVMGSVEKDSNNNKRKQPSE